MNNIKITLQFCILINALTNYWALQVIKKFKFNIAATIGISNKQFKETFLLYDFRAPPHWLFNETPMCDFVVCKTKDY